MRLFFKGELDPTKELTKLQSTSDPDDWYYFFPKGCKDYYLHMEDFEGSVNKIAVQADDGQISFQNHHKKTGIRISQIRDLIEQERKAPVFYYQDFDGKIIHPFKNTYQITVTKDGQKPLLREV